MENIEKLLPKHKASLHITHNQHKSYYETIEEYLSSRDISDEEWATPTSKSRAIEGDTLWELQWYEETPIGSYTIYGASLSEVIEASK